MSKAAKQAVECFTDGFSCSQAVLASHCDKFGLEKEIAYKVAGAFGGGMGHIGETCGVVTGALMLIGLKYGKFTKEDLTAKDKTYEIVKEYIKAFKGKYGSIKCSDLIKYDLSKHDELLKAREAGVFKKVCPLLVKNSVEMIEKYIE